MSTIETLLNQSKGIGVSEKYKAFPTQRIVEALTAQGFELVSMNAAKPRTKSREGYQRHLLRFSHPETSNALEGHRPDLVVLNSYDGTSSISMMLGVYRFACANGLIVGTGFGGHSIRHVGEVDSKVINAASDLVSRIPQLVDDIKRLQSKETTVESRIELVRRAVALRTGHDDAQLISRIGVMRPEDTGQDAWTIFNRIQELIIRQGFAYYAPSELDFKKRRFARGIRSIGRATKINQSLWDLANEVLA